MHSIDLTTRTACLCAGLLLGSVSVAFSSSVLRAQSVTVVGEDGLRRWHRVSLTLTGPRASESATPNPFLDMRFSVRFEHPATRTVYDVPGYFAADGRASESGATAGQRWRAHLSPDHTGLWTWRISFRRGARVAISRDPRAGAALAPYDGLRGGFQVLESNKGGRDHRGKGRLQVVPGKHHLRFANGQFFLKAGADSPENLLAYADIDNTPNTGKWRKTWQPHVRDWRAGDPTWRGARGKGLIGALNYLAAEEMNAVSFLTYSFNGDDKNVFPYVNPRDRLRFDCSKLDQWELVFAHADRIGLYLHFKTQETENDQDLDRGLSASSASSTTASSSRVMRITSRSTGISVKRTRTQRSNASTSRSTSQISIRTVTTSLCTRIPATRTRSTPPCSAARPG